MSWSESGGHTEFKVTILLLFKSLYMDKLDRHACSNNYVLVGILHQSVDYHFKNLPIFKSTEIIEQIKHNKHKTKQQLSQK